MSTNLKDKVVVITGGASGIGLATAKLLASRGAKVSIADIQQSKLDDAVSDITSAGGIAIGTIVDVRSRPEVEHWITNTVSTFGPLDGCANIAGTSGASFGQPSSLIVNIDDADWEHVMGINVTGVMNCMRAQIPHVRDGGSIVNAASIAGLVGSSGAAAYTASKHAVIGLTRTAAKECAGRGIRVNCLAPGLIDTPMLQAVLGEPGEKGLDLKVVPLGRKGGPEEVAELVAWLLCNGSSYVTGSVQVIDGGMCC